jgi:integrase/recombinase XerC
MSGQLSLLDGQPGIGDLGPADRAAVAAVEAMLAEWRRRGEEKPALALLTSSLASSSPGARARSQLTLVTEARDVWLSRLRGASRSESTARAYSNAIDDLVAWATDRGRDEVLLTERAVVEHLDSYRRARSPMPATYHRRFILLRRFVRWVCQRHGLPDPFVDLDTPPKPRQTADWLTPNEFGAMLAAAADPRRKLHGLAERDRLVLLALVTTGLRRAELLGLDWQHLLLDGPQPSALVHGKGDRPRRQPLAPALVDELRVLREQRRPAPADPVFCGLQGGRLSPTILAAIVSRNAASAGLEKRVTAHTLRHTAATWLRQQTGDARLVAEFLGHADLSTVARYAHVAPAELHAAADALSRTALPSS